MINDGKPFEDRVASNFKSYGIDYQRLHDQMSGLKGSTNPCDFIAYSYPNMLYIECKSCGEDKFDMLHYIREFQWIELIKKDKVPGTRAGYLVWMSQYQRLFWVSAFLADIYYRSGFKRLDIKQFEGAGIEIAAVPYRNTWHYSNIVETILKDKL